MPRALIIGYGNIDRADDGVAHEVVNALRRLQGRAPLSEEETGLEALGAEVDTVFLSQLTPELVETIRDYDRVVFVDAHVYPEADGLHCRDVGQECNPSIFTHHVTPGMLLGMAKALLGHDPIAHIVSVRGHDFDFHRRLSPLTRKLAKQAVDYICRWLEESRHADGHAKASDAAGSGPASRSR